MPHLRRRGSRCGPASWAISAPVSSFNIGRRASTTNACRSRRAMSPDSPFPLLADAVASSPSRAWCHLHRRLARHAVGGGVPAGLPVALPLPQPGPTGGARRRDGRAWWAGAEGDPDHALPKDVGPAARTIWNGPRSAELLPRAGAASSAALSSPAANRRCTGVWAWQSTRSVRLGFSVGLHTSAATPDALARSRRSPAAEQSGLGVERARTRSVPAPGGVRRARTSGCGLCASPVGPAARSYAARQRPSARRRPRCRPCGPTPPPPWRSRHRGVLTELAGATVRPGSAEPAESAESAESAAQPRRSVGHSRGGATRFPPTPRPPRTSAPTGGWTAGYDQLIADARASVPSGTVRVLAR